MSIRQGHLTIALATICFLISLCAYSEGTDEHILVADQVAIGEYEEITTLDKIRLATAPYINKDILDEVAINFAYRPSTSGFDASEFYSGLIDHKVMLGQMTAEGKYQIVPLDDRHEPWTVSATRAESDPRSATPIEATEEIAARFNDYLQHRRVTEDASFSPKLENWYNFVNWYIFAANIDVDSMGSMSTETQPGDSAGHTSLDKAGSLIEWGEQTTQLWSDFFVQYILIIGLQADGSVCDVGTLLTLYTTIYGGSGDGNTDSLSLNEVSEPLDELFGICNRTGPPLDVDESVTQIEVDSLGLLKDWNGFADWYSNLAGTEAIDWTIEFPVQNYAFVGVSPSVGEFRGERVVSWNARTYDPEHKYLVNGTE